MITSFTQKVKYITKHGKQFNMSKQKQELFVSANESAVILQQFMGRPRFISFVKEAIEHLEDLQ